MTALRLVIGYAGFAGFLISALMTLWHGWRVARTGGFGLLWSDVRFLDRARHPPEARPHVRAIWRWAGAAAVSFVLFAVGPTAM